MLEEIESLSANFIGDNTGQIQKLESGKLEAVKVRLSQLTCNFPLTQLQSSTLKKEIHHPEQLPPR